MIDQTTKYRLSKTIDKISDNTFDESDIRTLLIEIRDYLPRTSVIRDLAHFIAHPKNKDRGFFHQDLSLFVYRVKRAVGLDKAPIVVKEMSEEFYQMTIYGIRHRGGNILINRIPYPIGEAVDEFKSFYEKDKKLYKLKEPITKRSLSKLTTIIKHVYGTMEIKAYITQNDLINMLIDALSSLKEELKVSGEELKVSERN